MASLLTLAAATTSCGMLDGSDEIIEPAKVEVTDGRFTPEVLELLARVSDPQVSPDGKRVLYGIQAESIEQNKSNRELWLMNIDGSEPTRLTVTACSEQGAVWLDDNTIAFIANEKDQKPQVYTMAADGSGRKAVTAMEKGVEAFRFAPDGKHLALVSTVKAFNSAKDKYKDLDKATGRLINDLMYKHWDEWVEEIPHIFVAETGKAIDDSTAIDLLAGEPFEAPIRPFGGTESFDWSKDSKKLVYVSRKKTGKEYSLSTNSDLYEYDLEKKTTRNLTEGMMGYDTAPVFSHDGTKLAWLSMEHDGYESDKNRIFVMDVATGEKTDLTAEWDYHVDQIAWSLDDSTIYFIAPYQGTEPIFALNVATKAITTVDEGMYDYASFSIGKDCLVALRHSLVRNNELFCIAGNDSTAAVSQISHVNDTIFAQLDSVTVEKVMVPTTDGKEMLTWLVLPPNFDPAKKYPAILYCQGGPQSAVSQFWSYRWNLRLMASRGYIVIAPNRRGLPGFGTEWNAQISGDYPGQNMKDYLSAVDYIKQRPYIDADHIGATGASYGGYSVYWLAGNHDGRFKAFFAHAGIFNLESQYLETEEMWFANWDLGGPWWDKSNAVAQRTFSLGSPHHYIDKWDTPIMISVGEKDYRILASQGMMAFNAAQLRDVPARMLVFPDENHWILKPQNALQWQREFFEWFDKWLKPEQAAAPATDK